MYRKKSKRKEATAVDVDNQSIDEIISELEKEKQKEKEKKQKRNKKDSETVKKAEAEKNRIKQNKRILRRTPLTMLDLIPFKKPVDEGESGFEMLDGTFFNVFQVITIDMNSSIDTEVGEIMMNYEVHFCSNEYDEKMIATNMAVPVGENVRFLRKKMNKTTNPLYKKQLEKYINDFLVTLRYREDKEFFMIIYVNSYENLVKLNTRIESTLIARGYLKNIDYEKKLSVFRKFFNPFNDIPKPKNTQ